MLINLVAAFEHIALKTEKAAVHLLYSNVYCTASQNSWPCVAASAAYVRGPVLRYLLHSDVCLRHTCLYFPNKSSGRAPLDAGTSACRVPRGVCRSAFRNGDLSHENSENLGDSNSSIASSSSHITSSSNNDDSSSSSSVQQWALSVLATAGSNVPLRSTVLCLGVLTVLLAHGGTAHAAESMQPAELHHFSAQPVFGILFIPLDTASTNR